MKHYHIYVLGANDFMRGKISGYLDCLCEEDILDTRKHYAIINFKQDSLQRNPILIQIDTTIDKLEKCINIIKTLYEKVEGFDIYFEEG